MDRKNGKTWDAWDWDDFSLGGFGEDVFLIRMFRMFMFYHYFGISCNYNIIQWFFDSWIDGPQISRGLGGTFGKMVGRLA